MECVSICLSLISEREYQSKMEWFTKIYNAANEAFINADPSFVHSSLFIMAAMLNKSGEILKVINLTDC